MGEGVVGEEEEGSGSEVVEVHCGVVWRFGGLEGAVWLV